MNVVRTGSQAVELDNGGHLTLKLDEIKPIWRMGRRVICYVLDWRILVGSRHYPEPSHTLAAVCNFQSVL